MWDFGIIVFPKLFFLRFVSTLQKKFLSAIFINRCSYLEEVLLIVIKSFIKDKDVFR